jgi:hypothetical protein
MEKPEIDILAKVAEKKKLKSFVSGKPSEWETQQKLLKTIDCDYKTWKLQWEANHDQQWETLSNLIVGLDKLRYYR